MFIKKKDWNNTIFLGICIDIDSELLVNILHVHAYYIYGES